LLVLKLLEHQVIVFHIFTFEKPLYTAGMIVTTYMYITLIFTPRLFTRLLSDMEEKLCQLEIIFKHIKGWMCLWSGEENYFIC